MCAGIGGDGHVIKDGGVRSMADVYAITKPTVEVTNHSGGRTLHARDLTVPGLLWRKHPHPTRPDAYQMMWFPGAYPILFVFHDLKRHIVTEYELTVWEASFILQHFIDLVCRNLVKCYPSSYGFEIFY